jgi:environmental stress-induced protein Ves
MTLHHEEKGLSKKLELYQPYEFSGDWQTNCEVSGPSQDLNLMIQRSRWGAQSRTLELGASRTKQKQELPANATWLILFAISGRWHCESSRGEKPESLAAFDTALYHKAEKTLAGPPSPTLSQTPQDEFISVRCEEPGHLLVSILWLTGEHQP